MDLVIFDSLKGQCLQDIPFDCQNQQLSPRYTFLKANQKFISKISILFFCEACVEPKEFSLT